jgi:hypothetical protein
VGLEAQLGFGACALDHAGKPSRGERRAPFRGEDKWRLRFLLALEPPQGAQLAPEKIGCVLGVPFLILTTCMVAVLKST